MRNEEMLSEVIDLIQEAYPDQCVIVPPSARDTQLVMYTKQMQAIINVMSPVTFVVLNRTTGEPVTWGDADSASDAVAIVVEWLAIPAELQRRAA